MGRLHHLQDSSQRVHLLYSTSDKLDLYVYDTLKAQYNCRLDAVLNVDSPSQLKRMADVSLMTSMSSDAWFFNMEYRAVKNLPKILAPMLRDGTGTSVFLLKVRNYGEFKAVKELAPGVNDLYMTWLRREDIGTLLHGLGLPDKLYHFVSSGYSSEPDRIVHLRELLLEGKVFSTSAQIVSAIGVSAGSTDKMIFDLLKPPPKALKRVLANRMQTLRELVNVFGPVNTKRFLLRSARNILDLKMLWMNGIVYDRVGDLPPPYSEMSLRRYTRYLDTIKEIPLGRILKLIAVLDSGSDWYNESSMQSFLYSYFTTEENK